MNQADSKQQLRSALIEVAARLIATEGLAALTLRRVAAEAGTSTMAIYTRFGGMDELRRAVRREGYARLLEQIVNVAVTDDPVADLAAIGRVYYGNAIRNPHLYRVMFLEQPLDEADAATGSEAYELLVAAVERCLDADRFNPADPRELAREFWALGHGVIALELAELLASEEARECLALAIPKLFIAWGDDRDAARLSALRAAAGAQIPAAPAEAG